jgi:membrane associated rhomboid family serine protease
MGVHDRDYYRDESRGPGWFSGTAQACKVLIFINGLLFFAFFNVYDSPLKVAMEANSDAIFKNFKVWQLLSAAFLHKDLPHIIWNMLFLWFAGKEVESRLGAREFTFFYLTAAVFSTLCWALVDRIMPYPGRAFMLGASGAIAAVVMVYVLDAPRREMLLFFVLPVEAWLLPVIFLSYDAIMLVQEIQGARGPGFAVAFAAHLGGAFYGFLFRHFDLRWGYLLSRRGRRPRLRVVSPPAPRERERPSPTPAASSRSISAGAAVGATSPKSYPEEQLDARLDEVLAKIAREGGRSGLTEDDIRILEEASRRARDRRSDRS